MTSLSPFYHIRCLTASVDSPPQANAKRLPIYDLRFTNYDLLIMCALRKFFESSTCADEFASSIIMMTVCCHDF